MHDTRAVWFIPVPVWYLDNGTEPYGAIGGPVGQVFIQ